MRSISFNVSFKTYVSLFIFCFDDRSISVSGVSRSSNTFLSLSISPLYLLVFVLCIEVLLCWVHRYLQLLCLPLGLIIMQCSSLSLAIFFILKSILSDTRIATPAFFCFPFAQNMFLHPLTFSLYVSLGLKWVSCRQHKYGSCLCIHTASLCLVVGAFNPITFKIIIDILLTMPKLLTVWITINCGKFWKSWEYQTTSPASWETYMHVRKQQLELDMEQQTGSK